MTVFRKTLRGKLAASWVLATALAASFACIDGRDLDLVPDVADSVTDTADSSVDLPDAVPGDGGGEVLPPLPYLDVMFVVDNSMSMAEEQAMLAEAMPEFLTQIFTLATARGLFADVHIGVVSTDMGTMGYRVTTCDDPTDGDNGCLLHDPNPLFGDCEPSYPPFLARTADDVAYPIADFANDFKCIGTLGTNGCGFERQFAAGRKAVLDNAVPGGCNSGFLRDRSVVAVVFVTDENDCSVDPAHPEMFDESRRDLGHLNVRCFLNPDYVTAVDEYTAAFRSLEAAGHAVVVGVLAGVPVGVPECNGFGNMIGDCLAQPEMQERLDPGGDALVPSCNAPPMGLAFPPRRLVELVQDFGPRGYVTSICQDDYKGGLTEVARTIIAQIPSP